MSCEAQADYEYIGLRGLAGTTVGRTARGVHNPMGVEPWPGYVVHTPTRDDPRSSATGRCHRGARTRKDEGNRVAGAFTRAAAGCGLRVAQLAPGALAVATSTDHYRSGVAVILLFAVGWLCISGHATQTANWSVAPVVGASILASLFLTRTALFMITSGLVISYLIGVSADLAEHWVSALGNVGAMAAFTWAASLVGVRLIH